jgi:hypothetical protein
MGIFIYTRLYIHTHTHTHTHIIYYIKFIENIANLFKEIKGYGNLFACSFFFCYQCGVPIRRVP